MFHIPVQNLPVFASGSGMIKLPQSGTDFTHGIFRDGLSQFPDVFPGLSIPDDPRAFKADFEANHGDFFVRFEAARATHPRGNEVAQWVHDQITERMIFGPKEKKGFGTQGMPLKEHMADSGEAFDLETIDLANGRTPAPYQMGIPFRYLRKNLFNLNRPQYQYLVEARKDDLRRALTAYRAKTKLNGIACNNLRWCSAQDCLDLSGQKFVVMGSGAETAPTHRLLAAGASVLWIDVQGPSPFLDLWRVSNGQLVYPRENGREGQSNLLTEPLRIAATIREYAGEDPVHLVNVAYADGIAPNLAVAQNVITQKVAECVQSMSLYISPTIPNEVDADDVDDLLAYHSVGHRSWAWSVVPSQGLPYQLSQYAMKLLGGIAMAADQDSFEVRLDTANIAETESLRNRPDFALAFAGAPEIGAETFDPETSAAFQAHLLMYDRLNEDRKPWSELSPSERVRRACERQVHGNILTLGGILDKNIRRAGMKGMKHRPELLWPLAKRLAGLS